ncbi:MAG TPA: DUF1345 domain-containing protein [Pseudolabrys sp.]|jgi:uncharacterized membrane protein|nr:DUF1345 domain-containing protein [Pseudolabrys sp.]
MSRRTRDPSMLVRLARIHARLLISAVIGVAVTLASSTTDWRLATRMLTGWDVGVGLYLIATYLLVSRSTINEIRHRAAIHDEGAAALLVLTPAAAIASLAAIVVEFGSAESAAGWAELAFGMGTILLSWLFLHIVFALHYAHEYYGERSDDQIGGLKFPGQQSPDYWDFVYFSFVIAMTSQVSDVAITSKVIRRVATVHGVLSFFFNVSVLALTVNMVSNLIKPG